MPQCYSSKGEQLAWELVFTLVRSIPYLLQLCCCWFQVG